MVPYSLAESKLHASSTTYAAGVRQQAGIHAQRINVIVAELLKGHPINERDLREVLGHTPLEVVGGILLGMAVATTQWLIWK